RLAVLLENLGNELPDFDLQPFEVFGQGSIDLGGVHLDAALLAGNFDDAFVDEVVETGDATARNEVFTEFFARDRLAAVNVGNGTPAVIAVGRPKLFGLRRG